MTRLDQNDSCDSATEPAATLRIGDPVPNFRARSTAGPVEMKNFAGRWLVFLSHPADFTPVCTSEFIAFAKASGKFAEIGCDLMALSVDSLYAHFAWVRMIRDQFGVEVRFPIVEDPTLVIGRAFGMVAPGAHDAAAVRTVFVIDPDQVVRAMVCYPVEIGRSVDEILRLVTALQAADAKKALAPEGWQPGDPLYCQPEPTLDQVFAAKDASRWFLKEQGDD